MDEATALAYLQTSLASRIAAKLVTSEERWNGTPHLIWTGALDRDGYGVVWDARRGNNSKVHRVVHELEIGPIPGGLVIDHLCRVRACGEAGHIEPVTSLVNIERGIPAHRLTTHCPRGHAYDALNTYHRPDGKGRDCNTCLRIAARARSAGRPISRRDIPTALP